MKEEAGRSGHCCWVQGDFRGQRKCSKSGCGDAGTTLNKLETINVYPFPFLAMLGPRGCTRASSGCGGQGPALAAVDRGCSGRGGQGPALDAVDRGLLWTRWTGPPLAAVDRGLLWLRWTGAALDAVDRGCSGGRAGFSLRWLLFWGAEALECAGFSSCSLRAHLPYGMRDLPGPRMEPMSPALVDGFLTTGPPRKPQLVYFHWVNCKL